MVVSNGVRESLMEVSAALRSPGMESACITRNWIRLDQLEALEYIYITSTAGVGRRLGVLGEE